MKNPSRKGSAFERAVCRRLSEWWTDGKRDDIFWRTTTSGARATSRAVKGRSTYGQYGDIQATDPMGEPLLKLICFELKCGYPLVSVGDLLDTVNGGKVWNEWIKKAKTSAEGAKSLYWMIVFKKGRRQPMVIYPKGLHDDFGRGAENVLRSCGWFRCPGVVEAASDLIVTPLEDVLAGVSPGDVYKIVRAKKAGKR